MLKSLNATYMFCTRLFATWYFRIATSGITVGSAAGGLLFNVAALPGAAFVLTAGLAVLAFLLSLGLPHLLVLPGSCPRQLPA